MVGNRHFIVSIAKVVGQSKPLLAMNNFYTESEFQAHSDVVNTLKGLGAKGGEYEEGANRYTVKHAEGIIRSAIDELNLEPGSTVVVGVSWEICGRCRSMGQSGEDGSLKIMSNGVRIIMYGRRP
jgi:hypothetical protein